MDPGRASNVKGQYVCPKCGNKVIQHTHFTGWEDEKIDPGTGEAYKLVAAERSEVHGVDYFCPRYRCDWKGDEEWFDSIREASDEI